MEDKRPIKISFLIPSSEIGGTERMLILMLEGLPSDIFSPPAVFAIRGPGKFTRELEKRGIRVYTFNLKTRPFDFIRILSAIKNESPDILHTFLFYGNITGRIIGKILKIPIVISSQRSTDPWRKKYHWIMERLTAGWTDIIISNSYKGRDILIKRAGIPPEKIKVIPNGIRLNITVKKITRESLGIGPDEYIVGTVGNLRKAKGHIYLILSAPFILKELPNTRFVIIGEGELKDLLIKETKRIGVFEKFVFTGFVDNPADIVSLFDVFVFPSLWEGCPVALLEAMMLARSCVAFPAGDIPYIVENGINGVLVEDRSSEALARAVVSLLKDKELRERMGKAAYKRVCEHFSLEVMMKGYISVYLECLAKRRERR